MKLKDLKVGDMVFIREDLEPGTIYCGQMYVYDMGNGVKQVKNIYSDKSFTVIGGNCYLYASEMIDWEKTRKLQNNNCYDFAKITQFVENGKEETVALTNNGKEFAVTNNDKENDIEKAVMMLMLKSLGVTYGDVKKEAEKVKVKWVPKKGEKYYWINYRLEINWFIWEGLWADRDLFKCGNCFETREEAEGKLEKIKEILRGE